MAILDESIFYNILAILIAFCVVVITFFKWKYSYWNRLGVPTATPSIPFGNLKDLVLLRKTFGTAVQDIYKEAKSKSYRHIGLYFWAKPIYMPIDPEIIKNILQKDFAHFMNRNLLRLDFDLDPLAAHLFNLDHEKWKVMRQKLSPTFTSGQLKAMFQTVADIGKNLEKFLKLHKHESLDIKDVLARYTTDTIGSCAFGVECNSIEDPNADFRKHGRLIFEQTFWNALKSIAISTLPAKVTSALRIKFTNPHVENFFMSAVKDVINYRESNEVHRKDFMDLLIQIKNHGMLKGDEKNDFKVEVNSPKLNITDLAAHVFGIFIGGFETSSTTMTFALYELAQNQEIQNKLRSEINMVLAKHGGKVTYDAVMEMYYLQNVIDEALRMYPSVPLLNRECTADYKIPNSDIVLKKGTNVIISNLGTQMDPEYFPNPEKFDPDRFTVENKNTRPSCVHLPFGDGPRNCIGLRFGLLQTKIGLITLLKDYRVTLSQKTSLPLVMDPKSIVLTSKQNIWLDIENASY